MEVEMQQPRSGDPGTMYECTGRTINGQMRMVPTAEVVELIIGVVMKAKEKYGFRLYGLVFMSNHYHILVGADDAQHLANFMGYIAGNITRELNNLQGVSGPMWHRRYRAIPVSERVGAARMRMRYILAHGVKEKLVGSIRKWPGASSARWLLDAVESYGVWTDRTAMYRAGSEDESAYQTTYRLEIDLLPEFQSESEAEAKQRELMREMGKEIEAECAAERKKANEEPVGLAKVLATDPFKIPETMAWSRAPRVHAKCAKDRRELERKLSEVRNAYAEASAEFRAGKLSTMFPMGTFRPHGPFEAWPKDAKAGAA